MITNWFNLIMSQRAFEGLNRAFSVEVALIREPPVPFTTRSTIEEWEAYELQNPPNIGYARKPIFTNWMITGTTSPILASNIGPTWDGPPNPPFWEGIAYYLAIIELGAPFPSIPPTGPPIPDFLPGWFGKVDGDPIIMRPRDTVAAPSQKIFLHNEAPAIP